MKGGNLKKDSLKILGCGLGALGLSVAIGIYVVCLEGFANSTTQKGPLNYILSVLMSKKVYLLALTFFILFLLFVYRGNKILRLLYRYRLLVAIGIFVLCVIFEINGSSLGMWSSYLGQADTGNLLGVSRGIRSDEWAVSTPMMMSQYYNTEGAFPYFGNIVRGTSTDMFMVYGQPVLDIAIVFKPFYWGYLFLSAGKGLAFFWYGRWIALFVVSFEFFMLITNKDKKLSFLGACMLAFAPVVQWWFAINGLVEMLVYGQLAIIMLKKYMTIEKTGIRFLSALVIFICAGGFILTLYPAWQIPMAYVILALGIWVIMENHQGVQIYKKDIILLVLLLLTFLGIFIHIWNLSKETIELVMNTTYPGKRIETGGGCWKQFFNYTSNIWYALLGKGTGINVCESAQFIDFFPMCYIIPGYVLIKEKKKDNLLKVLLLLSTFLIVWCNIGFPMLLAKVTLMSYSTAERAYIILGLVQILLLIRSMSVLELKCSLRKASLSALVVSVIVIGTGEIIWEDYYPSIKYFILTFIIFFVLFLLIVRAGDKRYRVFFSIICSGMLICTGALVNPIRQGVGTIYATEEIKTIEEISYEDPKGLWIIEGLGFPYNNIGIMAGAATINSTNVYPDLERWKLLDHDGKYEDIYNRYAHIIVELKDSGEPQFVLNQADVFTVKLTVEDLQKIGVNYILTVKDDLENIENEFVQIEKLKQARDYSIFKLKYDKK